MESPPRPRPRAPREPSGRPGSSATERRRRAHRSACRAQLSSRSCVVIVSAVQHEHYQRPDWFTKHVFNRAVAVLTRAGCSVWGSRVPRARGRKSGEWRSSPVNLLTYNGKQYLVPPPGHTQWVRNIRVSATSELMLGNKDQPLRASEIPTTRRLQSYANP